MYVNSYGNRPPNPNWKYGRNHWAGCICDDCRRDFYAHQVRETHCVCVDCDRTRPALQQAKENQAEILSPEPKREIPTMATVNLCDKCGTMGKSKAMGTVVIVPINDNADVFGDAVRTTGPDTAESTYRLEICPGCVQELMEWKAADPKGERPRAYSDPWSAPKPAQGLADMDSATLMRLAIEASGRELGDVHEH